MVPFLKRVLGEALRSAGDPVERAQSKADSAEPGSGDAERDAFAVQKKLLDEYGVSEPVVFDVGSHIGMMTRIYLKLFSAANIFCFEPFPDCVAVLEKKFAADERVRVIPAAVTGEVGKRTFYVNKFHPTNSLLPRPSTGKRYYPEYAAPEGTIEVEATTLDRVVEELGLPGIDILKLDIQGGELSALRGGESLLSRQLVTLIYAEVFFVAHYRDNPLYHHIGAYLEQFGYSLYNLFDLKQAENGQLRFANAIFVSPALREQVVDGNYDL